MNVAIIGGGWAGLAAAVRAAQSGHAVTVFEAARSLGGRARAVPVNGPDGSPYTLDNGQHILIGAYSQTLQLMRLVGVDPEQALLRQPLSLRYTDGTGLALPDWPSPLDALAGILGAKGWTWPDKLCLLRRATAWQLSGFQCASGLTVAHLCAGLSPRLQHEFIEPLCISALNTPAHQACGQVFLRVLQDALFGPGGGSNLLLPRLDLGALLPQAAARWVVAHGGQVRLGQRVRALRGGTSGTGPWAVDGSAFDQVIVATAPAEAARLLTEAATTLPSSLANAARQWASTASALRFEAITTVYARVTTGGHHGPSPASLARPMLALRTTAQYPAQFVFDRGQLGGPAGLLAFVISASQGDREALQNAVVDQAQAQLQLAIEPLQTIVEKRATFACTPGLARPAAQIAPGLQACGDHCQGPYPATLEGAVRSGWAAGALG